jgi:hypothetical protein
VAGHRFRQGERHHPSTLVPRRPERRRSDQDGSQQCGTAHRRIADAEIKLRYPGPHKRDEFVFLGEDGQTPPDDRDLLRSASNSARS